MPKLILAAVFDVKAAVYSPPLGFQTLGMAERFMMDEVSRPDSNMARYPADFDLRQIGEYNTDDASLSACDPKVICTAAQLTQRSISNG